MKLNTFSILLFFTDWSTSLKSTSICLLPTPISLIGTVFLLHFKFFLNTCNIKNMNIKIENIKALKIEINVEYEYLYHFFIEDQYLQFY